MRGAHPPRTPMAAQARLKHTTQERELLPRRCRVPTPTEAGEVRQPQRTATPRIASIKRPLRGPPGQCKLRTAPRLMARTGKNGNSAAVGQTANGDKYAAANGNTYKNTGSGWSGNSNNTPKSGSQLFGCIRRIPRPRRAGVDRKRVAGRRPSAEQRRGLGIQRVRELRVASAGHWGGRSGGGGWTAGEPRSFCEIPLPGVTQGVG